MEENYQFFERVIIIDDFILDFIEKNFEKNKLKENKIINLIFIFIHVLVN